MWRDVESSGAYHGFSRHLALSQRPIHCIHAGPACRVVDRSIRDHYRFPCLPRSLTFCRGVIVERCEIVLLRFIIFK